MGDVAWDSPRRVPCPLVLGLARRVPSAASFRPSPAARFVMHAPEPHAGPKTTTTPISSTQAPRLVGCYGAHAASPRGSTAIMAVSGHVGPDHGACGAVPDMPPGAFIWPAGAPVAYIAPWGERGGCFYCNSGRWVLIWLCFGITSHKNSVNLLWTDPRPPPRCSWHPPAPPPPRITRGINTTHIKPRLRQTHNPT
jgi:hypothetical protein